jgi:3-oxoacyl-[acyl-carrier-protein] synthase II
MEAWQRIGTYSAGLALEDAGIKGDEALCASMDMIVAAGGGERDVDVDTMILARRRRRGRYRRGDQRGADDGVAPHPVPGTVVEPARRQHLHRSQGDRLVAHLHGRGRRRHFRPADGGRTHPFRPEHACAVGGAYNAEHPDMLLGYELGHHLHRDAWAPVWDRAGKEGGGMVTGSGGAFLVLESRKHAESRGVKIYATVGPIAADQGDNSPPKTIHRLERLAGKTGFDDADMIVSSASGSHARTDIERSFLTEKASQTPVRAISTATGDLRDAQFPLAVAVAAISLQRGKAIPPFGSAFEAEAGSAPETIGVISVGYTAAEGIAMLSRDGSAA